VLEDAIAGGAAKIVVIIGVRGRMNYLERLIRRY
jgi:hypothetical protein